MSPTRALGGAARGLGAFRALPRADRRAFARAWWQLAVVQARRRLARFMSRDALLSGASPRRSASAPMVSAEVSRLVTIFRMASENHVTSSSCLPRAVALSRFLAEYGLEARIRLGVRRGEAGREGHAWVEVSGAALDDEAAFTGTFVALNWASDKCPVQSVAEVE